MQSIHTATWIRLLLCAAYLAACGQARPGVTPSGQPEASLPASPYPTITPAKRTATAIPTPSPTPDLVATAQAASPAQIISSQVSPDGLWWARVYSHPCSPGAVGQAYGYDTLQITDQQTGKHQILASQLITCGGLGAYGLKGLFWAHASRYYYFTNAASGVPDGCGYWEPPLLRIDLTDGSITYLGIGSISPNGLKLAAWLDDELVIWDINGGRLGSAPQPVEGTLPGPIAWAPHGKAIAYLLSEQYCPLGLTYVVRMNLDDFQAAPFYASQDPSFADIRWDTPNRVILTDESGDNWAYNFITGNLAHYQHP